jgi:threonine synthase
MKFIETRGNDGIKNEKIEFSEAILKPSASFGGLYVPENLPTIDENFIKSLQEKSYSEVALEVLNLFEIDIPQDVLKKVLETYSDFDNPNEPVPLASVGDDLYISELYHGPTRAFKDMALQPFGKLLSHLAQERDEKYLIMVATSGDTGPATLETFKNQKNISVVCLYPNGGTSDVQRLQMVTEDGENLKVLGINGAFDDAQTALKKALASTDFNNELKKLNISLSAANSVNFGRIIFQTIYHIYSYVELLKKGVINFGEKIYLTVPSGNFGNALGGFYAKLMGLPVEKILISSNSNNILTDFISKGEYSLKDRNVVNTHSPAMDILKSSNVERVIFSLFGAERTKKLMSELEENDEYKLTESELDEVKKHFSASFTDEENTLKTVKEFFDFGYLMDTHTATTVKAHRELREKELKNVAYSTAEWTKFAPSILMAINKNSEKVSDLEALKEISEKAKKEIPELITNLFKKEVLHDQIIEKEEIENSVLNFLK